MSKYTKDILYTHMPTSHFYIVQSNTYSSASNPIGREN